MLLHAFRDTITLLNVRYQIIREAKGKFSLWVFILMMAFAVFIASYTGQFIKIVASSASPNMEAAKIYASTYLNSYLNGELGSLVATTLGLAIVSVMVAPFTGASATSLISHHYLVSVRSNTKHRFTDSLLTQFFSSISLLQLMTLTSVASMLTIDDGRKEGVLYAWASWPVLVILSTAFVWIAEYLYRRFGEKKRLLMLTLALGIIALVVFYNQEQAMTVFGVGTIYAAIIQGFYAFPLFVKILSFVILVGLWFLFAFLAYKISQIALSYPDMFAKKTHEVKTIKSRKSSSFPFLEMCRLAFMQLWRNTEIRKPIIMATGFSIMSMFFLSSNTSLMATVVFIIPLMISLSWGANVFGIVGNGLPWILSKPFSTRSMLWVFAGLQMVLIMTMTLLTVLPVLILGRIPLDSILSFCIAVVGCSAIMTRSAISKAVNHPYPYKSGYRGEPILPPATLIGYTIRFSLWAGIYGLIIFSVVEDILPQLGMAFLAVVWSIFRLYRLDRKFQNDPAIRNHIVFTVAYN